MRANYLLLTVAVLLAVGCGETDRLHDMQAKTSQMNDTTQDMDKTTNEMKDTTQHMDKTTTGLDGKMSDMSQTMSNLSDTMRQGGGGQLRREFLESMSTKQDVGAKMAEAGLFYITFEYQLWSGSAEDRGEQRYQELLRDAVQEFLGEVREYMPQGGTPNPLAQIGEDTKVHSDTNREASLNALSGMLNWTNRKEADYALKTKTDLKDVSMYTLLADALLAGQKLDAGSIPESSLLPYQNEVLGSKPVAIRVLENRLNFMPMFIMSEMMSYSGLSDLTSASIHQDLPSSSSAGDKIMQGKIMSGLSDAFSAFKMWGKTNLKAGSMAIAGQSTKWDFEIDQMDQPAIERLSNFIQEFEDTRSLLKTLKLPVKIDARVVAFAQGMQYKTKGVGSAQLNASRTKFVGALNQFKKDVSN